MFRFPWGDLHSLNLGWFLQKFNELRQDWATAEAGIDGALDAEIQKAEDALTDVFAARDAAAASASAANSSALNASQSSLASMDARDQSRAARDAAQQAAGNAAGSASAAADSASAAGSSASAASNRATAAADSATAAADSASTASNRATAAADSATAAADSASTASNRATAAADSATAAGQSASDAEEAAASVENSAQQIATNASNINSLKKSFTNVANSHDEISKQIPNKTQTTGGVNCTLENSEVTCIGELETSTLVFTMSGSTANVAPILKAGNTYIITIETEQLGEETALPDLTIQIKETQASGISTFFREHENGSYITTLPEQLYSARILLFFSSTNGTNYNCKFKFRFDSAKGQTSIIAPILDDMNTNSALEVNDFCIVNNTLYRVTAPIASGGTLTPGTNVEETTVGTVLKSLLN